MNFKSNRICTRCHKRPAFGTDGLGYITWRNRPICIECLEALKRSGEYETNRTRK